MLRLISSLPKALPRQSSGIVQKRPVEIAEQIVNNLMPLLDVLHDVAAGTELAQGTAQRKVLEESIKTLPLQLQYAA